MKRPSRPVRPGRLARCLKALQRLFTGNPRRDELDLAPEVPRTLAPYTNRLVTRQSTPTERGP